MPQFLTTNAGGVRLHTTKSATLPKEPAVLLRERLAQELAYYEADKPYLTTEKCAARCRWLSELLTALYQASD